MFKFNRFMNIAAIVALSGMTGCTGNVAQKEEKMSGKAAQTKPFTIGMIVGSTRQGRSSDKIAQALKAAVANRTDVAIEILDLRDFAVPFFNDEVAPASRKTITDPAVQRWSDAVRAADAFIMITPEYNAGFPGVLKNALDSLYVEWNNKPVGFVGYSGGPSGAKIALEQLQTVTQRGLQMKPVATSIMIGSAWKAFDAAGKLVDATAITTQLNRMIDEILATK